MAALHLAVPMVLVAESAVPYYLQQGELYKSLHDGSDDDFSVPADSLKADKSVESDEDLINLLTSLRYWVVTDIPPTVLHYIFYEEKRKQDMLTIIREYEEHFPIMYDLRKVIDTLPELQVSAALETGHLNVLELAHKQSRRLLTVRDCVYAAKYSSEECFLYVIQRVRPLDSRMRDLASKHGYTKCLDYLNSVHCPFSAADASS